MKKLHTVTALIEAGAGVALMGFPSVAVKLLLGTPLDSAAAEVLGRLAGAALFALGIACWLASRDARSQAARGLAAAMLFYNFAAVALFALARFGLGLQGVLLWPAVILHAVMTVWCIACLRCKPSNESVPNTGQKI